MTDPSNGFAFKVTSSSANAFGGKLTRRLLVIARNQYEATVMARGLLPSAQFETVGVNVPEHCEVASR